MAKNCSGLFHKTHGEDLYYGSDPDQLKEKAFAYAEEIFENGNSKERNTLNTVCVVYDEKNNNYYYGRNKGIELHKTSKNVIIFGDDKHTGLLPKTSLNDFPLGNCAEVDAINNALNAGAQLEYLHIVTLDVKKKNIRSHNIVGKCACENCTAAFKNKIKQNHTKWKE